MAHRHLPATREGLIEALELVPDFVAGIVIFLADDTAGSDGWAHEQLVELEQAAAGYREAVVGLMADRRRDQGSRN